MRPPAPPKPSPCGSVHLPAPYSSSLGGGRAQGAPEAPPRAGPGTPALVALRVYLHVFASPVSLCLSVSVCLRNKERPRSPRCGRNRNKPVRYERAWGAPPLPAARNFSCPAPLLGGPSGGPRRVLQRGSWIAADYAVKCALPTPYSAPRAPPPLPPAYMAQDCSFDECRRPYPLYPAICCGAVFVLYPCPFFGRPPCRRALHFAAPKLKRNHGSGPLTQPGRSGTRCRFFC